MKKTVKGDFESHPLRHFNGPINVGLDGMRTRSVSPWGEQAMPQASGESPEQSGANPILSATLTDP
jgi:hypothetical protein